MAQLSAVLGRGCIFPEDKGSRFVVVVDFWPHDRPRRRAAPENDNTIISFVVGTMTTCIGVRRDTLPRPFPGTSGEVSRSENSAELRCQCKTDMNYGPSPFPIP
ncbi:hypothetical protein MTP99_008748 [Tenebrio molitor]|nr:hypothetical protein MTP99_008748 [Tenebrio molitor]